MQTLIDFADPQSVENGEPQRYAFGDPIQVLVAHTLDQVRPLLETVHLLAAQGRWCVGYLRYEAGAAFDQAMEVHETREALAWFGVHEAPQAWPEAQEAGQVVARWSSTLSRPAFAQGMSTIHSAIADGELYQINYTAPLCGSISGTSRDFFMALRRAQPGGYAAFIDTGDEQVLSVSPELFFDWDGERILTRPMKGTAPRGATPQEDAMLATQLKASAKERAENVMIVDLIRNDLSRLALPFSVRVPHLFRLEALPTVWQMTSDVVALTRPGTTLADLFAALFPCGSITGAPKVRAMHMIKELEPEPRGVYCGAVGLVRPGGAATFNVAIRTVSVQGNSVRCGVGSGVTAGATEEGEWQEWRHKRAFLERASQPFELLETLALCEGSLRDIEAHVTRMGQAAAHFGYPWDLSKINTALSAVVEAHRQGMWRVRLRLDARGTVQVEALVMDPLPARVRIALALSVFEESQSEFVRFKTTHRAHYDAFTPSSPTIFDTLLWNRFGELTECTRGNVALRLVNCWVTPPLRCGLLDGIGRARYLRDGSLKEAVVHVDDLAHISGIAFMNSLRGWLPAELVELPLVK